MDTEAIRLIVRSKDIECASVASEKKKPIIGILGGIGAGKSTVAAEFAKLGCAVIDADQIVHQLLGTDAVKAQLRSEFGEAIFDAAGQIDRKKLADITFADPAKLQLLNDIIHPPALSRAQELIGQFSVRPKNAAIILDMPLLAEIGWEKRCDKLIFVDCPRKIRLNRLKTKPFYDEKQLYDEKYLKVRENFQISLDTKAKIAHYIISNNSDLPALARQVARVFSCIINSE